MGRNKGMSTGQLLAFGCGYVARALAARLRAQGVAAFGTARTAAGVAELEALGVQGRMWPGAGLVPPDGAAWLISAPPDADGCPVFRAFGAAAASAGWIGYLSTTGVYGDLAGGWAFEWTPRHPLSQEAANRARAEDQWTSVGARVFRLPGIYGPGRSALDRVREGARRIVKPGQVFSRAHRDDIAAAIAAAMALPHIGGVFNICDDEPAPADEVLACAATLLGRDPPPAVAFAEAGLSPAAQRFYAECKRVSNARVKAALGWRPAYPTYRQGLAACLASEAST